MTNKEAKKILEWELNSFKYTDNEFVEATKVAIKALEERPKGKWIEVNINPVEFGGYTCDKKCPFCEYITSEYLPKFCSHCGADMRGDV